jgi:pre-rRNA-processing protein TSR3
MQVNVLMYNQDDPKKCTAAKLVRFSLAKKVTNISKNTLTLNPFADHTLLNSDKKSIRSITGIDCSWNFADQTFVKKFGGISRKLPYLLAGNSVNFSKLGKLTTVEAIAASLYLLGFENQSTELLGKFKWGHTFLDLNKNLLNDYQNATSEGQIQNIAKEYSLI